MVRITPDFRLIEIEYELWGLGQLLKFMEPQIARIESLNVAETYAALKEQGWEDEESERQLASQELDELHDVVVPRFMRGPFVVALWACYESGVVEVAEFHRRAGGHDLTLKDLRGGSFLIQARRYFEGLLRSPLEPDSSRAVFLTDLYLVRNVLAHANGQRRVTSDEKWRKVALALDRHSSPVDEYRGFVVLSPEFVQKAFEVVNASLRELVKRARAEGQPRKADS